MMFNRDQHSFLGFKIQLTTDNSNLRGKSKKVPVIGSSSYRETSSNEQKLENTIVFCLRALLLFKESAFWSGLLKRMSTDEMISNYY